MKSAYAFGALAVLALSQNASAVSFNARCEFWNDDKAFELNAIIVQHLGTPASKLGVSMSTLTMVDSLDKNLVFSDEISHLNTVAGTSDGVYERVSKAFY